MSHREITKQDEKNKKTWNEVVSHVSRLSDAEELLRKVHYHLLSSGTASLPDELLDEINRYYMGDPY